MAADAALENPAIAKTASNEISANTAVSSNTRKARADMGLGREAAAKISGQIAASGQTASIESIVYLSAKVPPNLVGAATAIAAIGAASRTANPSSLADAKSRQKTEISAR